MKISKKRHNGKDIAIVDSTDVIITDISSALDMLVNVKYETDCDRIVLSKSVLAEEFFILSSGLAGDILQKFINYQTKLAIWGDFSHYTSQPLHDFIYESNQGNAIFFAADLPEALEMISKA